MAPEDIQLCKYQRLYLSRCTKVMSMKTIISLSRRSSASWCLNILQTSTRREYPAQIWPTSLFHRKFGLNLTSADQNVSIVENKRCRRDLPAADNCSSKHLTVSMLSALGDGWHYQIGWIFGKIQMSFHPPSNIGKDVRGPDSKKCMHKISRERDHSEWRGVGVDGCLEPFQKFIRLGSVIGPLDWYDY